MYHYQKSDKAHLESGRVGGREGGRWEEIDTWRQSAETDCDARESKREKKG